MRHLTLPQLSASLDDALSGVSLELVRRHFLVCEECRARAMRIQRTDGLLAQLLSHQPGVAWMRAAAIELDEWIEGEATGNFSGAAHPAGPPPLQMLPRGPEQTDRLLAPRDLSAIPGFTGSELSARSEEGGEAAGTDVLPAGAPPASARAEDAATAAPATPAAAMPSLPADPRAPVAPSAAPPAEVAVPATPHAAPAPPAPVAAARSASPVPVAVARSAPPVPVAAARPAPPPAPPAPARWGTPPASSARPRADSRRGVRVGVSPLLSGLVGGAVAGALIVVLFFAPRIAGERDPGALAVFGVGDGETTVSAVDPFRGPQVTPAPDEDPTGVEESGGLEAANGDDAPAGADEGEAADTVEEPVVPERDPSPGTTAPAPPARTSPNPSSGDAGAPAPAVRASTPPVRASTPPVRVIEPRTPPPTRTATTAPTRTATTAPTPAGTGPTSPGTAATATDPVREDEDWPLLCGQVQDESATPIAGARVLLADLDLGARTDRRGRFCIAAPPGSRTLSVQALGFATHRRLVTVAADNAEMRIVLKEAP